MLWRALLGLEHHLLSFVLGQAHVPSKGTPKSHPGGGSRLICCHLLPSLPSLHTALGCLFIPVSSCLRSPWGICSLLAVCVCLLSSQHVQWLNSVAVKNPTPALHSRELLLQSGASTALAGRLVQRCSVHLSLDCHAYEEHLTSPASYPGNMEPFMLPGEGFGGRCVPHLSGKSCSHTL